MRRLKTLNYYFFSNSFKVECNFYQNYDRLSTKLGRINPNLSRETNEWKNSAELF